MIGLSVEQRLARAERAAAIIAEFEQQRSFTLPTPWRATVEVFLLQGLEDHQLDRTFNTLMQVEHEAVRLADMLSGPPVFTE